MTRGHLERHLAQARLERLIPKLDDWGISDLEDGSPNHGDE